MKQTAAGVQVNLTPVLCDAAESVLLVIDIQTRLTSAMPAKVLARLQRNAELLLKSATALEVPVFATEQYPDGLGGMEAAITSLLPENAKCYDKTSFSCAGVKQLLDDLSESGRRQVIILGMEAHVCVLQSAIELRQKGYEIIVIADAVCSRHRESYETALQRMRSAGITIADCESVLFEWLRDANNPFFKQLQGLIR